MEASGQHWIQHCDSQQLSARTYIARHYRGPMTLKRRDVDQESLMALRQRKKRKKERNKEKKKTRVELYEAARFSMVRKPGIPIHRLTSEPTRTHWEQSEKGSQVHIQWGIGVRKLSEFRKGGGGGAAKSISEQAQGTNRKNEGGDVLFADPGQIAKVQKRGKMMHLVRK
jgi:hypothetical protein